MDESHYCYESKENETKKRTCKCITKIHFEANDICILNLRPNHYDPEYSNTNNETNSDFVKSILEANESRNEKEDEEDPINDSSLIKKLFNEIKIDLNEQSASPKRSKSVL